MIFRRKLDWLTTACAHAHYRHESEWEYQSVTFWRVENIISIIDFEGSTDSEKLNSISVER